MAKLGKAKFVEANAGFQKGEGVISLKGAKHPVLEKIDTDIVPVILTIRIDRTTCT